MSKVKKFSCLKCGYAMEVYPPDDMHPVASLEKDKLNDTVEMDVECHSCSNKTKLYWGRKPITVRVG